MRHGGFGIDMGRSEIIVVGCGISGSAAARYLAEKGKQVEIWERRNHIGGNMYDYVDTHGCMVHQYGPHIFHTKKKWVYEYMHRFSAWREFSGSAGAVWDGKYTPTPFNFTTIDTFFPAEHGKRLKEKLLRAFPGCESASVAEVMAHTDSDIQQYGRYLFENDYAPYSSKQWGIPADKLDPSVLARVPVRFSYDARAFVGEYQIMPEPSYNAFFQKLLDHPRITLRLGIEAREHLKAECARLWIDGKADVDTTVVYTGALDELFDNIYGALPYRSLRFDWQYSEQDCFQPAVTVAYPQAEGYTRITDYKKFSKPEVRGSSYAVEYPMAYQAGKGMEPYYPVLTKESQKSHARYRELADKIPNLLYCGRLADFKYYDMDQALERALTVCRERFP